MGKLRDEPIAAQIHLTAWGPLWARPFKISDKLDKELAERQASAYSANCWTTATKAGGESGGRKLIYLSKTSKHPCSSSEPDKSHIHRGSCRETGLAGTVYTYISSSDGCRGSTASYIQHRQWEIFPVPGLSWGTATSIHGTALDAIVADLLQHVLQQHCQLRGGNVIWAETMSDYAGIKDDAEQRGFFFKRLLF